MTALEHIENKVIHLSLLRKENTPKREEGCKLKLTNLKKVANPFRIDVHKVLGYNIVTHIEFKSLVKGSMRLVGEQYYFCKEEETIKSRYFEFYFQERLGIVSGRYYNSNLELQEYLF